MRKQVDVINELKAFWGVKDFLFEAQYAVNRKGNGFFRNLRKQTDKTKIFLPNGNILTVSAPKELKFEEDKSYLISVFVPNEEIRAKFENDYIIFLDTKKSPPKPIESKPETYVKSLESEYKSVIGIGLDSLKGAIKRISYDINRKPETFIFELLQNADDYPDKQKGSVVVSFKIVDEYLVFQHNGLPFSANNVRALCSVDAGDKDYDFEKIGYKGIGFKSIFKHSNYVVIHSGGYTFKFDENYHRAKGIDTFWQLIPIWTELSELPDNVQKQVSDNFNVTVIIKPEEGNSQLNSYEETFNSIFKDERVLLFLRHVEHFSFRGTSTNIIKCKDSNDWTISKLDAVAVPEELQKTINAKIKVDDRIPQKYEDIDKTILTFATHKIDGKLVPTEQAHLYAYLPTDLDFGFPFLLNGDFIPDGGRHYLHADLEWNQFLFKEAGKNLLKWIASIWTETKDIGAYDMLPDEKKLVSERPGDEKEVLLKCFLGGLIEVKNTIKFIATGIGELSSASEIILDETGVFSKSILPESLFYQISKSTKKLPHCNINIVSLFSSYLEIEKFTSKHLVDLLIKEENKEILKVTIKSLKIEQYLGFLNWFNGFSYINIVPNEWLLSMPIIRTKDNVVSLNEALTKVLYHIKSQRTKSIEVILTQIGFDLSEIYIDDHKYQYLNGVLMQQDSYLKNDLKLYEHIAIATPNNLSKLTANEKNTLITFFESLDEVGKAKYAKSLALFKSKKEGGALKPLNSLISNSCVNLPIWLNDFVIDPEEENALSTTFQTHLLKEKDLLEKLFCNSNSFTEIIANINTENIAEFYTYILKLHENKTQDANIDFTKIPWVFIESNSTFATASIVYWPESITKLSPHKYASVKSIFETITDEKLPHQAALQIKAPFALGGKDLKLTEITPKPNLFDVISINDFLDWAEANGEKDLLNHFSFSNIDDKFSIGKVSGTLTYYTADESLIKFIESSAINTKLSLLPKELHTIDRSKIGLLEGVTLLKYLIENRLSTPALAKYIQSANDPQLSLHYLVELSGLNINTSKSYNSSDNEFITFKLAIQHIVTDKDKLKNFRSIISIDGQPLLERAISEDVYFYDKNVGIKTKLSEILPNYKDRTFPLTEIIEKFEGFEDNKNLVAILKDEGRTPKKIFKELNELKPVYYSPKQTFFLSYYKTQYPNEEVLEDKVLFSNSNSQNKLQFTKEIHEFLDVCLKENSYIDFVIQDVIPNFTPANLILNEKYAIESETIPEWLKVWLDGSNSQEKLKYLAAIGINWDISPVVVFRQAILDSNQDYINSFRESITNNVLLINTLLWLSKQKEISNLLLNKELLQPLYQKLHNRNIQVDKLLFPCLEAFGLDSYSLQTFNVGYEFHFMNEGWGEYKETIFSVLKSTKKIFDDVLPKSYRDNLKAIEKPFVKFPDLININANSYQFDEEYYQEWDLKGKYNIRIYKGSQLPYLIKYNDILIKNISERFVAFIDGVFYLVESAKDNIFTFLAQVPEFDALQALRAQKQLFDDRKESEKWKVKFTLQELEALRRLFGDEIPSSFHKDLNVAALVTGLIYLNSEGFDIGEAELNLKESHKMAQLLPVYSADKTKSYTVMCRSAKSGLLYITARAWNRLDDNNTWLFVTSGKKETDQYLFKNKQDVLNISVTDFQVFRVESESKQKNIDDILTGKFDLGKIWLIFKMADNKSYNSIFGDGGGIKRNEENPDYDNLNTAENSPY